MKKIKLLISHTQNKKLLKEFLSEQFELVISEEGTNLKEPFQETKIDLIIVDHQFMASEKNYIEKLKSLNTGADFLPVLLITDKRHVPEKIFEQVDEIINIPVTKQKLRLRLENLLQTRELFKELSRKNTILEEKEAKFRAISEFALDAIILVNERIEIVYWNPMAERIFGYTSEEASGLDPHDIIIPKKYREYYKEGIVEFTRTGEGDAVGKLLELTAKNKQGEEFPIEATISAIKMGEKTYWASVIIRDITERKKSEEVINEYAREIDR